MHRALRGDQLERSCVIKEGEIKRMTKRAVVVGVNDYSAQGQPILHYCVSDAKSIYDLLINGLGFDQGQVLLYTDAEANRETIINALRTITLGGTPGDVACFYFSGHGARVSARPEQADCDKYYEAILPASGAWISDREIYQIADSLQPSFVNFTLILDSCHSGGIHESDAGEKCRTIPLSKDVTQAMVQYLKTVVPCGICIPPDADVLDNNVRNVSTAADGTIMLDEDLNRALVPLSKSTLIAACEFNELSWEDSSLGHGLMTQAFLDIVNSSEFHITYLDLLNQLRARVGDYITSKILPSHPGVTQVPHLRGQLNRMEEGFLEAWIDSR